MSSVFDAKPMNEAQKCYFRMGVDIGLPEGIDSDRRNYSHTKKGPGRKHLQGRKKSEFKAI